MINNKNNKGFTLIELIVVMAIFLFVIGAAIGIFLSVIQNQRKVLAEQQLLSQISYVQEYMSKALRMAVVDKAETDPSGTCMPLGYIYLLTRHPIGAGTTYNGIRFINPSDNNACQEFFLSGGVLKELKNSPNDVDAMSLTSTNLQINFIKFSVNGLDGSVVGQGCIDNPDQCGAISTDGIQPKITILLNISIPGGVARTIQTTVSQRNLNTQ